MSAVTAIEQHILGVLIGLDGAASAALFESGSGVTISTRCAMAELAPGSGAEHDLLLRAAATLDAIQRHHCAQSLLDDLERARAVVGLLEPYESAAQHKIAGV
jgi:hypothetical protein